MTQTLKRCPFCGSKAEIRHVQAYRKKNTNQYLGYFVLCTNCLTSGDNYSSEKLAANAWNRRYYVD